MFCFRKTSFVHSRSGTYYFLLLGCFGLKSLPDVHHCVYWVLAEIWAPDSFHKIDNKIFIDHCQGWKEGSFVCETVWFFPRWILIRLTWNLSHFVPNSVEILTWNFREKIFWENFSEIFAQTKAILLQDFFRNPSTASLHLFAKRLTFISIIQLVFPLNKGEAAPNYFCSSLFEVNLNFFGLWLHVFLLSMPHHCFKWILE